MPPMRYHLRVLLALTLALPAYGVVPIPYVSEDQIELDGQLDDWYEVLGPPSLTASDFLIQPGHAPLYSEFDPENLDFRIWLGWSPPGRVFAAAEFADDVIRDDGGSLFYQADGLVIAVTPDSRREEMFPHLYAVRPAGNLIMPTPVAGNNAARWSARDPFARGIRTGQTDTSWGIEFFFSCFDVLQPSGHDNAADESIITNLATGDEINLVIRVTDWDADDRKSVTFSLSPEGDVNPVRALLLSPGDTAVRQQTWGGVKASLNP